MIGNPDLGILSALTPVPDAGFIWVKSRTRMMVGVEGEEDAWFNQDEEGPWLTTKEPQFLPQPYHLVSPYNRCRNNPGLHRRFARCSLESDKILLFANRFGRLGHGPDAPKDRQRSTESLAFWQAEILTMRAMLELWDLVREGPEEALRPYIFWKRAPLVVGLHIYFDEKGLSEKRSKDFRTHTLDSSFAEGKPLALVLQDPNLRKEGLAMVLATEAGESPTQPLLEVWPRYGLVAPARFFLEQFVTARLEGHIDLRIRPGAQLGDPGTMRLRPDCLLSRLYALFALELTGGTSAARVCLHDPTHIFVPASNKQRFCSDNCRVAFHRARKRTTNRQGGSS